MSTYRRANATAQWYADRYPGARMDPNVVVIHTTEGTSWPSYSGGATAPNDTAKPNFKTKRLLWRAHFPDEMSSRALQNDEGGVETNTLNCVQVELVGTCDPKHRISWAGRFAGKHYIYWPEAPDWALNDLAEFLADLHERHGIKLDAPALWLPYPKSYGASAARMSGSQWRGFYGVCGHQHVPENAHGDPGNLDIVKVLDRARSLLVDATPAPIEPVRRKPTRVQKYRREHEELLTEYLEPASQNRPRVRVALAAIRTAQSLLPRR